MKERPSDKKDFWENELKSLGIEPKRENEFNDKVELEALTEIIKQVYYQAYKTAYGDSAIIIIPKDQRRNIAAALLMVMVILRPYITFISEKCL